MPTRDEVMQAIRNADAAGDSASVRKLGAYLQTMPADAQAAQAAPAETADQPGKTESLGAGLGAGFGKTVLGAQYWLGRGIRAAGDAISPPETTLTSLVTGEKQRGLVGRAGDWLVNDAEAGRTKLDAENAPYAKANPATNAVGKVGGEIAATFPVGGVLASPLKAVAARGVAPRVLAPIAEALSSSGMSAGGAQGVAAMGARMLGGAAAGGASAALVDPDSAASGAVIGALMPPAFKAAGMTGDAFASLVRPFFASGQQKIVADVLKQYASDPDAALQALKAARNVIPGSDPLTAAAAGDIGLSGLTRTMQNASPEFANELAQRATAQNAARTAALEGIAGNTGKISTAKAARDAATGTMRESALSRAGNLDASGLLGQIDAMAADPNNAGRIAQQALQNVREQIARNVGEDGTINARALYALRKDINDVLGGKLQGEAGNLRHASGQLTAVKGLFDDAINAASRRPVQATGTAVAAPGGSAVGQPATSWGDYLAKYTELSKPINQMEALQDVMKRVQTGSTDTHGNLLLSAAKLNQILKNEGPELAKMLTPAQLQQLRNLAADLNASQIAMTAGKSVGSNTMQNLSGDALLRASLGSRIGGSQVAQTTLGNLLRLPYGRANQAIQQKLGDALLNPQEAARLLEQTQATGTLSRMLNPAGALAYRSAPLLPGTSQ